MKNNNSPYLSLIIPSYNEGQGFNKCVNKIIKVLKGMNYRWEIIFVEDKSQDTTIKTVEEIVETANNIRAVFHSKNLGRGKSVADGIRQAKGEICGFLDVDLEVSASYIPLFISEIEKGNDLVVGKRFYEAGLKSLSRVILSKAYSASVKAILALNVDDTEAGYKFFKRTSILPILSKVKSNHWFWDTEICAHAQWQGLKISQVPVIYRRRLDKKSTVKIVPDTFNYIKNLIRLKTQSPSK